MKEIQEGMSRRVAYANRVAEEDGCKVAEIIARRVQETGESYTWSELNKIMAWPGSPRYRREIMTRLEETGWISTGPEARSLRPGASFLRLSSDYR
jgi:DNA-binding IclR family transcriptional regulator